MSKSMNSNNGIVANGHYRAREANKPIIRAEVEKEFADRLREASPQELPVLQKEMEREIELRLERVSSRWALY